MIRLVLSYYVGVRMERSLCLLEKNYVDRLVEGRNVGDNTFIR